VAQLVEERGEWGAEGKGKGRKSRPIERVENELVPVVKTH